MSRSIAVLSFGLPRSVRRSAAVRALHFGQALAAAALIGVAPNPLAAQEPQDSVITACYVPRSGTVYRIKATDAPQACTKASHIEFSWTRSGTVQVGDSVIGITDHGALIGLGDDDHPQYLRADGTRALTADLSLGGFKVTGLDAAAAPGDAVRYEQAVKQGEGAGGDLAGSYPDPTVAKLRGRTLSDAAPQDGEALVWSAASNAWAPAGISAGGGTSDHGALAGLDEDDHPQYLLGDGVRHSVNGFAVTGTENQGTIPASGAGARMMWYPAKAAFRAGYAWNDNWDDANIGQYSVAFGRATIASGQGSAALVNGHATGNASTAIGISTLASGPQSVAIGLEATASGVNSIAVGHRVTASGYGSLAFGHGADTNGMANAFVFGDGSSSSQVLATTANHFVVRAQRFWFGTNNNVTATAGRFIETSTGAYLSSGGTWTNSSDVARKENFEDVDGEAVLEKVAALPVLTWNYRDDDAAVRHMGPTAQDFRAAFGLGDTEKAIATVDADGVSLAAIQALERRTDALRGENQAQADEIDALRRENRELRERLDRLEVRNRR